MGISVINPDNWAVGTAEDDVFVITDRGPTARSFIDGLGGIDHLLLDRSFDSATTIRLANFLGSLNTYGNVTPGDYYSAGHLNFYNFESFEFVGTAGNDSLSITFDETALALQLSANFGAGFDSLTLDFARIVSPLTFIASGSAITSSFGSFAGFERFIIYGGAGNDEIRTSEGNDELRGGAGSNILDAGGGSDQIYSTSASDWSDGGTGTDTWSGNFASRADALLIEIGDSVRVNGQAVAVNMESMSVGGGSGDDTITVTTALQNYVYGNGGIDLLRVRPAVSIVQNVLVNTSGGELTGGVNSGGFSGIERVDIAGSGLDDVFQLMGIFTADQIVMDGAGGNDRLAARFELLTGSTQFLVNADATITTNRGTFGNFETYVIQSGAAADTVRTGLGADSISAGGGNDAIDGGGGNDYLAGDSGDDLIEGGAGDDSLDGGSGIDTMVGGSGDDLYFAVDLDDIIIENIGEGTDTVHTAAGTVEAAFILAANVENLILTGYGQAVTGNSGNNSITGTYFDERLAGAGGDDILAGMGGTDSLSGGTGDDRLMLGYGQSGSTIDGGDGIDTLSIADTTALAALAGIEVIELSNFAQLVLTGSQAAFGLAATTRLAGLGTITVDMESGTPFIATQFVSEPAAQVRLEVQGTTGIDVIKSSLTAVMSANGGDGADQIRGGNLADTINGGAGNDKIMGLAGADILTGGTGADQFRYLFTNDSGLGAGADRILDFTNSEDKLDFRTLDANPALAGRQALAYIGTAAFAVNGTAQVRYADSGGDTLVQIDLNGDGAADMEIVLVGHVGQPLTGTDFLL